MSLNLLHRRRKSRSHLVYPANYIMGIVGNSVGTKPTRCIDYAAEGKVSHKVVEYTNSINYALARSK